MAEARTSVVIPCYREDRYLLEALNSVCLQSQPVLEVIVVDDGSPQPLPQPTHWAGPTLKWIRTKNQGLGAARNQGISLAEGEFVAFLDSDDHWHRDKIAQQESLLDANPDAVACYTQCIKAPGYFPFGPYPNPKLPRDPLAVKLWQAQFFPPSSVLARRSVLLNVAGFREGLRNGEDLDMWFRLFEIGEIYGVSIPLTWYRQHEGQITSDDVRKILGSKEARRGIMANYSQRLVQGGISKEHFWDAYRSEILGVYFRRKFGPARKMLWDYLKDHPFDLKIALYFLISNLPAVWVQRLRGKI
ncbi:MAG TPA: hypothetical protein DDZ51_17565 [Planctomycetaceae bacterium]|nr:hypothetical protein [Planctomycetaceae bacterium]